MSLKPIKLGPFVLERVRLKVVRKPLISDGEEALEFLWHVEKSTWLTGTSMMTFK